jgi:structural maintenance of chromosomes protein 5
LGQRHINQSHNRTQDRQLDLKEQQRRLVEDESRAKAEVNEREIEYVIPYHLFDYFHCLLSRLKRLDDDSYRKLQNLAQYDPDCAAVINWLRANKDRFRREIIEPAAISLTVPNKDHVHAVEACFNITQLKVRPSRAHIQENSRSSGLP